MRLFSITGSFALPLVAVLALFACGCTPSEAKKIAKADKTGEQASKHDAWWCDEHGIPEDECSMCSSKVANACKAKGDWCDKHNRARSQCFICEPALQEVFAAKYRAHYPGKEPPPIEND